MTHPLRNRVLVVDDDPVIRQLFQRSLELAGFDVVVANGGEEGLRILRQDSTIGVVLLDFAMPRIDGREFRRVQLADPTLALVPTIIVTGSTGAQIDHNLLQAAGYLQKPVAREPLINAVAVYCRRRHGSAIPTLAR